MLYFCAWQFIPLCLITKSLIYHFPFPLPGQCWPGCIILGHLLCGQWLSLCSGRLLFPCHWGRLKHPAAQCPSSPQIKQCAQSCRPSSVHCRQQHKRFTWQETRWLVEPWHPLSRTAVECCKLSTRLVSASILAISCLIGSSWPFFTAASIFSPTTLLDIPWTCTLPAVNHFVLAGLVAQAIAASHFHHWWFLWHV